MDEQEQFHHHQLAKHSRICGSRQQEAKSKASTYDCAGHREELLQVFLVATPRTLMRRRPEQKGFCIPPQSSPRNGYSTAVTVG